VWSAARRNRQARATAPLTAEEQAQLAALTRREE
jgi:hypothetical protein